MKIVSTRQAAKELGIHFTTLAHYLAAGKIPMPRTLDVGTSKLHAWTEEDIEKARKLLPKIANGRKTRYQKKQQPAKAKSKTPKKK